MNIVNFLLDFAFDFLVSVLILRFWLQIVRADYYNPLSQFVIKVSNPFVIPLRRVIPGLGGIDLATLIVLYIVAFGKWATLTLVNGNEFLPIQTAMVGLLYAVKQAGVLLFILMIVMAIMSWVVQGFHPMHALLNQLTEPFLRPIRKIVPVIGGLDLSVLVAFLLLNVVNMFIGNLLPIWRII